MSEGGSGPAEVKIRLVTDDRATITVEQLREALKGGNEELGKGHEHAEHLGRELFKAELYVDAFKEGVGLVAEGMHQAWEMTEKLADAASEAADESNKQVRAMTGLMSMMDQGAHSVDDVHSYAEGLREDLAHIGTQAGESTRTITEMFDSIIERGALSTEKAKDLTESMALVGKVVPRGAEGLAEGFNMMELGIIRARNPLVQLISATHVLQGNAHAVAAQMQKMTPERQMEAAMAAIERQAEKMRKGGDVFTLPTLDELKASFGNIRESILEGIGEPLNAKLLPALGRLRDFFLEHEDAIVEYAEGIGRDIGKVVDVVGGATRGIYEGVTRNWEEVHRKFKEIFGDWYSAWDYATTHTDEIQAKFRTMTDWVVHAFETAGRYIKATAEVFMDAKDLFTGHTPGETQAAISHDAMMDTATKFGATAGGDFNKAVEAYRAKAMDALPSTHRDELGRVLPGPDPAEQAKIEEEISRQREFHESEQRDMGKFQERVEAQDVGGIGEQIDKAREVQDKAFLEFALNTIGESDSMTRALETGGIHIQGGFESLRQVIDDGAPELAKRMKKLAADSIRGDGGIKGMGPTMNFFGGIHIKQDFRDQDSDRVLVSMRRDIYNAAVNRRQSRLVTPFGL